MAPKTIAKAALYLSTSRVPLHDLSTGPESGWRPLNVKRVAELAEVILKGDFGNTVLGKPSLLCGQDGKARRMGLSVESWFAVLLNHIMAPTQSHHLVETNLTIRIIGSHQVNVRTAGCIKSYQVGMCSGLCSIG